MPFAIVVIVNESTEETVQIPVVDEVTVTGKLDVAFAPELKVTFGALFPGFGKLIDCEFPTGVRVNV